MVNDINIKNTQSGVDLSITGNVTFSKVKQLVQSCKAGSCDCSSEMLEKINSISASGTDGDVLISLKSDSLNASEVKGCMNNCDCGF